MKSDGVCFITRRSFFKWRVTVDIPITCSYDDETYQKIVGKFFIFSGRMYIEMETIGLIG